MKIFLRAENNEDLERIVRYNIGKAHQIRKELSILKELPNKNCIVTEPVMESVDLVQVECKEKEINFGEVGEILFKDEGISGIVIFNLSAHLARNNVCDVDVYVDYLYKTNVYIH